LVKNKTDRTDVDGLLEAFRNQQIRPVPIKTVTQQVIGTLHRLRSAWLADRTRAINSVRGLLRELGFFIPEGRKHVLPDAWEIIPDPTLPTMVVPLASNRPSSAPAIRLFGNVVLCPSLDTSWLARGRGVVWAVPCVNEPANRVGTHLRLRRQPSPDRAALLFAWTAPTGLGDEEVPRHALTAPAAAEAVRFDRVLKEAIQELLYLRRRHSVAQRVLDVERVLCELPSPELLPQPLAHPHPSGRRPSFRSFSPGEAPEHRGSAPE
jgi:hypothetical protein